MLRRMLAFVIKAIEEALPAIIFTKQVEGHLKRSAPAPRRSPVDQRAD